MSKRAVTRFHVAEKDDRETTERKIRAALERLFGKEYIYIGNIPAFDEALFNRISGDPRVAGVSSEARTELLKHQAQKKEGHAPVWGGRSLPANREEWRASDLVSAYYLAYVC